MTKIVIQTKTPAPKARPKAKVNGKLDAVYEAVGCLEDDQWFAVPDTARAYQGRADFRSVMTTAAAIRRWCNRNGAQGIAIFLADDGKTGLVVKKVADGVEDEDTGESAAEPAKKHGDAHARNLSVQPDPPRSPGKAMKKVR